MHLLRERDAGVAALALGFLVLCYGFMRHATVPRWAALLMAGGAVVAVIGQMIFSTALLAAGDIALLIGMAAVGMEVLLETGDKWEHPAVFEGWGGLLPHH